MRKTKKKYVSILLATLLIFSNILPSASVLADENADNNTPTTEDVVETTTKESDDDADIQIFTEDEFEQFLEDENTSDENVEKTVNEITDDEVISEELTEEVTTEEVTEEVIASDNDAEIKEKTFTQAYSDVDTSIDFSSKQLLIATDDSSIFTWDTIVLSEYNGIYLTEYETVDETRNAYSYYIDKVDFVDANIIFSTTDNEETVDLSDINNGDDALSILNDLDTSESVPDKTIALIDTGVNADDLVDNISVISDSAYDDNGHGTKMYNYIKEEAPNAKILSIKALDSNGKGNASDIYAAIQYAIERKVDVINLSISAFATENNEIIKNVINDAINNGIVVIGSAGNKGKDAKYYIPSCINDVVVIGACDKDGNKIASSNYGDMVDYYVVAESTSEATARYSGMYIINNFNNIYNTINNDDTDDEIDTDWTDYLNSIDSSFFVNAASGKFVVVSDGSNSATSPAVWRWTYTDTNDIKHTALAYCMNSNLGAPAIVTNPTSDDIHESIITDPEMVRALFYSLNGIPYLSEKKDGFGKNNATPSTMQIPVDYYTSLQALRYVYKAQIDPSATVPSVSDDTMNYVNKLKAASTRTYPSTSNAIYVHDKDYTITLVDPDHPSKKVYDYDTTEDVFSIKFSTVNNKQSSDSYQNLNKLKYIDENDNTVTTLNIPYADEGNPKYEDYPYMSDMITLSGDKDNFIRMTVPQNYLIRVYRGSSKTDYDPGENFVLYGGDSIRVWANNSAKSKSITRKGRLYVYSGWKITQSGKQTILYLYETKPSNVSIKFNITDKPEPTPYFITIQKQSIYDKTEQTFLNNVPISIRVKSNDSDGEKRILKDDYLAAKGRGTDTDGYITIDVNTGYLYNKTEANKTEFFSANNHGGTGKNTVDWLIYDKPGSVASGAGSTYKIRRCNGTVVVYLGMYFNEPTVEYKESWTSGTAIRVPTLYYEGTTKLKNVTPDYYSNDTNPNTWKKAKNLSTDYYEALSQAKDAYNELDNDEEITKHIYYLSLKKKSVSNKDMTGIQYTLYWNQHNANNNIDPMCIFTLGEDGNVATISMGTHTDEDTGLQVTNFRQGYNGVYYNSPNTAGYDITKPDVVTHDKIKYIRFSIHDYEESVMNEGIARLTGTSSSLYLKETYVPTTNVHELNNTLIECKLVENQYILKQPLATDTSSTSGLVDDSLISLNLIKESTASTNNPNYSLVGTKYNLYASLEDIDNKNPIDTFIVKANGTSNTIKIKPSDYGMSSSNPTKTFYIKEIDVGKNMDGDKTYNPSNEDVISKVIRYDDETVTFNASDDRPLDPIVMQIDKKDKTTNKYIDTPITNAQFKLTYYGADVTQKYTKSQLEALTGIQKQTYTITASKEGDKYVAKFDNDVKFEMGYLTLDEIVPPTGYKASDYTIKVNTTEGTKDISTNPVFILDNDVTNIDGFKKNNRNIYINLDKKYKINRDNALDIQVTYSDPWGDYEVWSELTSKSTQRKLGPLNENESATDVVYFEGFPKGVELHIKGTLYDLSNGNSVVATATNLDGTTPITIFSDGIQEQHIPIKYSYDSTNLQDHILSDKIVVSVIDTETNEEIVVYTHNANLDDLKETIYYPNGYTTAEDIDTGINLLSNKTDAVIKDKFYFSNLYVGETYTIVGEVHKRDKVTKKDLGALKDKNGNIITSTAILTITDDGEVSAVDENNNPLEATKSSMSATNTTVTGFVTLNFTVDATLLTGTTTTVFETVYVDDIEVFVHANIDDKGQQTHSPSVMTNITDNVSHDQEAPLVEHDSVTDIIQFSNIPVGTTITFNGKLMDKSTKSILHIGDKDITTSVNLVINDDGTTNTEGAIITELDTDTNTVYGTIPITFEYDSRELADKTLVAFIDAQYENADGELVQVALHGDYNDKLETIHYTKLQTSAGDIKTDTNVSALGKTTIVDRVKMSNLLVDREYTIIGTVHRKSIDPETEQEIDLGVLTIDGKEVTKTATIKVDGATHKVILTNATNDQITVTDDVFDGTIDIEFEIDKSLVPGEDVVVFEELHRDVLLASHNDITDKDQTIHTPKCGTTAMDDLTKDEVGTVKDGDDVTIPDTIQLTNVSINNSYKVTGIVMDKATNESLKINGKEITNSLTFTVDELGNVSSDNTISDVIFDSKNKVVSFKIQLDFTLNSKELDGKDIVIFETCSILNKENEYVDVCKEDDITNLGQTIHFPNITTLATDDTYGNHVGIVNNKETITEKSMLYNVVFGKEYEVVATVINQLTGEEIKDKEGNIVKKSAIVTISDDGKTVSAVEKGTTNTFTTEIVNTYADDETLDIIVYIPFVFDSTDFSGETIVIYEDLIHNDITVKSHHNKDDIDEQIHYYELHLYKKGVVNPKNVEFTLNQDNVIVKFAKVTDGVYRIDKDGTETSLIPDDKGLITIQGFNTNPYILTEIKTEMGKNLLESPITIQFVPTNNDNGLLKLVNVSMVNGGKTVSIEINPENEDKPNMIAIDVTNNETVMLHTGGKGTYWYYIVSGILVLLALGCIIFIKKKHTKND